VPVPDQHPGSVTWARCSALVSWPLSWLRNQDGRGEGHRNQERRSFAKIVMKLVMGVFSRPQSVWRNISGLHAGRRLQYNYGVAGSRGC